MAVVVGVLLLLKDRRVQYLLRTAQLLELHRMNVSRVQWHIVL